MMGIPSLVARAELRHKLDSLHTAIRELRAEMEATCHRIERQVRSTPVGPTDRVQWRGEAISWGVAAGCLGRLMKDHGIPEKDGE